MVDYDEKSAGHIRTMLKGMRELDEKKMFGGVGFLLNAKMTCRVHQDDLIVRIEAADYEAAMKSAQVRAPGISDQPLEGWVIVASEGCKSQRVPGKWVHQSFASAKSLPPKEDA